MTDCATKRIWLAEAENALHKLMTGSKSQTITFGSGKSVTYNTASISKLQIYINDLRQQVAACDGTASTTKRAPVRFFF